MKSLAVAALSLALFHPFLNYAEDFYLHRFQTIQLSDKFYAEGATFGDLNRDGHVDIVSGPYWWEGPDYQKQIGPDLTGSNRSDLEYLLENIVDPSATLGKDYQMWSMETDDGRFLSGLITRAHQLTVEIVGAHPQAVKAYMFGLDYLRVKRLQ